MPSVSQLSKLKQFIFIIIIIIVRWCSCNASVQCSYQRSHSQLSQQSRHCFGWYDLHVRQFSLRKKRLHAWLIRWQTYRKVRQIVLCLVNRDTSDVYSVWCLWETYLGRGELVSWLVYIGTDRHSCPVIKIPSDTLIGQLSCLDERVAHCI